MNCSVTSGPSTIIISAPGTRVVGVGLDVGVAVLLVEANLALARELALADEL